MKIKKYITLIVFISISLIANTQYYTPAQITTIHNSRTAFEGDMYLDKVNNDYYIGLTHGKLGDLNDNQEIDSLYLDGDTSLIIVLENGNSDTLDLTPLTDFAKNNEEWIDAPGRIRARQAASFSKSVVVSDSGFVGINTDFPQEAIHIKGGVIQGRDKSDYGNLPTYGSCELSSGIATYFTSVGVATEYFHIKLPLKTNLQSHMYHINVSGYAYGSAKVIELTYVGYCYVPTTSLLNAQVINNGDASITATQYVGSDNHIYLRFRTGSVYYNSFRVDSMRVGNGKVMKSGDIEIIKSAAANL